MTKIIYVLAITATLMIGAILTGCETKTDKVEAAQDKVTTAKEELKEAKQEASPEYPAFRKDVMIRIDDNDKKIAALRAKLAKPGKAPLDDLRAKRIDDLEKKNAELRSILFSYDKEPTDWQKFKADVKHAEGNVDDAFTDFGKDLKK
jgi:hypothetical protein